MKKMITAILAVVFASLGSFGAFAADVNLNQTAAEQQITQPEAKKFVLTDSQKKEVEGILTQINRLQKQLIDKYVGYGAISKEQGEAMKSAIDKRAARLKENGYSVVPRKAGRYKGYKQDKTNTSTIAG